MLGGRLDRIASENLRANRQREKQQCAEKGSQPDQRVEEEADRQIKRRPGQIKEPDWPTACEEASDLFEIAHRLQAESSALSCEGESGHNSEHAWTETLVK